jgi:hypothetical protein
MSGPAGLPRTSGRGVPVRVSAGGIVLEFPSPAAGRAVAAAVFDACHKAEAGAAILAFSLPYEPAGVPA